MSVSDRQSAVDRSLACHGGGSTEVRNSSRQTSSMSTLGPRSWNSEHDGGTGRAIVHMVLWRSRVLTSFLLLVSRLASHADCLPHAALSLSPLAMSSVRIVDPSGKTFSITGCQSVGGLKSAILEHCGFPVDKQLLRRGDLELDDAAAVDQEEEMSLIIKDVDGGCECRPFYIKIQVRDDRRELERGGQLPRGTMHAAAACEQEGGRQAGTAPLVGFVFPHPPCSLLSRLSSSHVLSRFARLAARSLRLRTSSASFGARSVTTA